MSRGTIVNRDELDWTERDHDDTFVLARKRLALAAGGDHLGCTLFQIPPDKRAHPYHFHYGNEEALYILAGEGVLRLAGDHHEIEAGDYCALPMGDAGAHQVINTGDEPLEYLAMSTMRDPDIIYYPDSDKLLCAAEQAPERWQLVPGDVELDYWDGEDASALPPVSGE